MLSSTMTATMGSTSFEWLELKITVHSPFYFAKTFSGLRRAIFLVATVRAPEIPTSTSPQQSKLYPMLILGSIHEPLDIEVWYIIYVSILSSPSCSSIYHG
jgi:hypothetical protein